MIDNIQKLYEIAGVPRIYSEFNNGRETIVENVFSPYRQLELIKLISSDLFGTFHCYIVSARWSVDYGKWATGIGGCDVYHKQFDQALAGLLLEVWNGIPGDQKQEIKRILQ